MFIFSAIYAPKRRVNQILSAILNVVIDFVVLVGKGTKNVKFSNNCRLKVFFSVTLAFVYPTANSTVLIVQLTNARSWCL